MVRRVAIVAWLAACGEPAVFTCDIDSDCTLPGAHGVCTSFGFCAFGDQSCPSGFRYHESAGQLAGVCVGQEGMTPMVVPGDTAGNPLQLQTEQTIDISMANDDYTPKCGGPGGRDLFFEARISSRGRLYLDTFSSDFDAVLVVASGGCTSTSTTRSCVAGACPSFNQWSDIVLPGTYCVIVDRQGGGGSKLVLRSMLGPAAPEVQVGTLSGDTCNADDWRGGCGGAGWPDDTWFTTTCVEQAVHLSGCQTGFTGDLQAWGLDEVPLGCSSACTGPTFTIPPGPAWLVAEDEPSSCGPVTVDFGAS